MNKIPLHKLHEKSSSGILLKHICDGDIMRSEQELFPAAGEAHRDNYYLFILLECGEADVLIDFKEYHIQDIALGCILPGQVHHGTPSHDVSGWIMCLDAVFIKDEWKEIFETIPVSGNSVIAPDAETLHDLLFCFDLLDRKIRQANRLSTQDTACALAGVLTGIIAEQYRQRQPGASNKRLRSITLKFKTLVAASLKTVKSPTQYASMLHISPAYLNEAVKTVTGFSAGYWIQYAVTLEAKRLLFYTDRSIKEIAFELGYDDHTYFTRLFGKLSGMPPSLFRANYRK